MTMYVRGTLPRSGTTAAPLTMPPGAERRMSATQRLACERVYAALNDTGSGIPNGIHTSTALGCLDDTERFLAEMMGDPNSLRSPVPFMRSTHNTIPGQLALLLGATGPNITYSQDMFGFHAALVGAMMQLEERPEESVLALAVEERTDLSAALVHELLGGGAAALGSGVEVLVVGSTPKPGDRMRIRQVMQWHAADDVAWEMLFSTSPPGSEITRVLWAGSPSYVAPPTNMLNATHERYDSKTGLHGARTAQALEILAQRMTAGTINGPVLILDVFGDQRGAIIAEPCSPTA